MLEQYYVKVEGTRGPKYEHATLASAYTEARRLFDQCGQKRRVFVLQAIGVIDPEVDGARSRTTAVASAAETMGAP